MIYFILQFRWRGGKTLSYGLMVPGSRPWTVTNTKSNQKQNCRYLQIISLQIAAKMDSKSTLWSIDTVFGEGLEKKLRKYVRPVNLPY